MLISKNDGNKLIKFLQTAPKEEVDAIAITAIFDMARPDNRVEYDLWYSSGDQKVLDFIEDFQKLDHKFDQKVLMTPHFKFFSCEDCSPEFLREHCFANGKYCGQEVKTDSKFSISGRNILSENIRQICLYQAEYTNNYNRNAWWDYINRYHGFCYGSVTEDCSKMAHSMSFLDYDATK